MAEQDGKLSDGIRDERGRFVPGNPGSPGRPKGSRHKLGEDFIAALQRQFDKRGEAALESLDNDKLVEACIKVLPKEIEVQAGDSWIEVLRRAADVIQHRGL